MPNRAITVLTEILRPEIYLSKSRLETLCLMVLGMVSARTPPRAAGWTGRRFGIGVKGARNSVRWTEFSPERGPPLSGKLSPALT